MKVFYITEKDAKVIDIVDDDYKVYYDLINCRCFDIANRNVGGTRFDIYCDDEGLFNPRPHISGAKQNEDGSIEPMLVGNLVFTHSDNEGNTVGITEEDVETIKDNIILAVDAFDRLAPVVLMDY